MFGRISSGRKMDSSDVKAVFYICPIENLESILSEGIHNHNEVRRRHSAEFKDLSNSSVQDIRAGVWVTKETELHDHVNFYVNPHNAMLHNLRKSEVCILRISPEVLQVEGAKLSTKNASLYGARFLSPREWTLSPHSSMLATSPRSYVYGETGFKRKNVRQAEALIPVNTVPSSMIEKIYVENATRNTAVKAILTKNGADIPTKVKPHLFPDHRRRYSPLDRLSPVTDTGPASPTSSLPVFSATPASGADKIISLDATTYVSTESDVSERHSSDEELSDSATATAVRSMTSKGDKRRKVVCEDGATLS